MAKAKKKAKKKTARKKAKKKAPARKKAKKKPKAKAYIKVKSKLLGEAPQEYEFYLSDGKKLKSVFELVDELDSMSEDMFREHVNDMKNDFSSWIKDVFEEPNLAKEIEDIKDRIETQKVLMKKLVEAAKKAHKK